MNITCLMMQKNEHRLLEPWMLYHGLHFGFNNLVVYDNGSSKTEVIDVLKKYESLGVRVIWEFSAKADFENKGFILSEEIKRLDQTLPSEFYFPMDCDEFLVAEVGGGDVRFDSLSILRSLEQFTNSTAPLAIGSAFDNNPLYNNYYFKVKGQRKTFFSKGTCKTLDLGYHDGRTYSDEAAVKTNICYVHFHYKEFKDYVQSAIQKLEGRINSFSRESLEGFLSDRRAGFHLVGPLLNGRDQYYFSHFNRFNRQPENFEKLDGLTSLLEKFGLTTELSISALQQAFESKEPRWRGYIDTVKVTPNRIVATGWFATLYDFDLNNVFISVSGNEFPLSGLERLERPDVAREIKYADAKPGLRMVFDTNISTCDVNLEDIEIYIQEFGCRYRFSLRDRLLKPSK